MPLGGVEKSSSHGGGCKLTLQPTDLAISFQCLGITRGQEPLESKQLRKQLINPLIMCAQTGGGVSGVETPENSCFN